MHCNRRIAACRSAPTQLVACAVILGNIAGPFSVHAHCQDSCLCTAYGMHAFSRIVARCRMSVAMVLTLQNMLRLAQIRATSGEVPREGPERQPSCKQKEWQRLSHIHVAQSADRSCACSKTLSSVQCMSNSPAKLSIQPQNFVF